MELGFGRLLRNLFGGYSDYIEDDIVEFGFTFSLQKSNIYWISVNLVTFGQNNQATEIGKPVCVASCAAAERAKSLVGFLVARYILRLQQQYTGYRRYRRTIFVTFFSKVSISSCFVYVDFEAIYSDRCTFCDDFP